jgi:hypothetical protein
MTLGAFGLTCNELNWLTMDLLEALPSHPDNGNPGKAFFSGGSPNLCYRLNKPMLNPKEAEPALP